MLLGHDWPGNVRELENAMEHAVIVEAGAAIDPASLPVSIRKFREADGNMPSPADLNLRERLLLAERQILLDTLERANGIRKRAAEMLGIDSRNMPYFLKKHHLQDKM